MNIVQNEESLMLIDKVLDNITQGVHYSKTKEIIKAFSEATCSFTLNTMIRIIFDIVIYYVIVKPAKALLEPKSY